MATSERLWSEESLKEAWSQLFSYSFYKNHYENLDVQCILMLLEGGLSHVKKLGMAYSALKASERELVIELEKKTNECWDMKKEMDRMGKPCVKCGSLEGALVEAKRRAKDAQARMDSIANILRLGDQFEPSHSGKCNAALDLVSQMILGSSPPTKRKKTEIISPDKLEVLACDTVDVLTEKKPVGNGIIPATMRMSPMKQSPSGSPKSPRSNVRTVTRSPVINVNFVPTSRSRQSLSKSCDPSPSTSKALNVKKNLSADFDQRKPSCKNEMTTIKTLVFDLKEGPPPLDDTLQEYIKKSTGKLLDNIWFSDDEDDSSKKENRALAGDEAEIKSNEDSTVPAGIIAETPCPKQKKADFWMLKEKRGPGEISKSSGRKMRQMKLELGFKKVQKKIDLTKIVAGKGSLLEDVKDDEDIIVASPGTQHTRANLSKYLAQESEVNTTDFKPLAASTQMPKKFLPAEASKSSRVPINEFDRLPVKETSNEPNFEYVRGAVKKKADREKLEGWDCKDCAEYYASMDKNLNPAEIKKRMNACSRHRNKFKPRIDDTPPGFWNPLLPDTQDYKGYYSICEKRDS